MSKAKKIPQGELVSLTSYYSLRDLCDICGVPAELILEMVQYGVLQPQGKSMQSWQFSSLQLQRSQKALRLQRDLELNLAGIALALDLMDELEKSNRQLKQLRHLLKVFHLNQ